MMGCDDALEVDEFVVVGDCIDDMSGCHWSNINKTENVKRFLLDKFVFSDTQNR
jgi:hypothetical protein